MTEYRAEQANDIPDARTTTGQYDENEIRVGALQLVVARQRSTIRAQRDEIERLGHCIKELEREGLELEERKARDYSEMVERRNACETPRSGQTENFWN